MARDPGSIGPESFAAPPRAAKESGGLDVFVPVEGDVDVRALLIARGEAIEPGLSVIDGDLPIAGLGAVDLVAIDAERRLVIVDLAGRGEAGLDGRPVAHARWFRENVAIVRRMYQLWNVRWEAPPRMIWISSDADPRAEDGGRSDEAAAGVPIERISVHLARTREGREALFLDPKSSRRRASDRSEASPRYSMSETPVAARAAAWEPLDTTDDAIIPRAEAYRREIGLTSEELAEFFADPGAAPRRGQGGGA